MPSRAPAAAALGPALDRFQRSYDAARRIGFDPVEFPRRYPDPADAEVAGLLASCLAYGRADVFRKELEKLLAALAPSPARSVARLAERPSASPFEGFRYRFNRAEDVGALLAAAGWVRGRHRSLGDRFATLFREARARGELAPIRAALAAFASELREAPPARALLARRGPRGLRHLCPDPSAGGASKRWNLYLRWMVRGPDGVDLGLWRGVPAAALVVPLDTHVARVARCLGLTARRDLSWRTAEEITAALRVVDPADPVRFDFALCHLGMSGACPPRRDPARCRVCPLLEACGAGHRALRQRPGPR